MSKILQKSPLSFNGLQSIANDDFIYQVFDCNVDSEKTNSYTIVPFSLRLN